MLRKKHIILPGLLALLLLGLLLARVFQPGTPQRIEIRTTPFEAHAHINRAAEVCGRVASARHLPAVRGAPTFLNLGRPYPHHPFTAVIFGEHRNRWPAPPEQVYIDQEICVTGRIREHEGRPQIVVREPRQIRLQ